MLLNLEKFEPYDGTTLWYLAEFLSKDACCTLLDLVHNQRGNKQKDAVCGGAWDLPGSHNHTQPNNSQIKHKLISGCNVLLQCQSVQAKMDKFHSQFSTLDLPTRTTCSKGFPGLIFHSRMRTILRVNYIVSSGLPQTMQT